METNREKCALNLRVKHLEKEILELKQINNVDHLENAEMEINELKATIESNEKEAEQMFNNLSTKKQILKGQLENCLKCDNCDLRY